LRRLPPAASLVPAYEEAGPDPIIPRLDPGCLPNGSQVIEAHYDLVEADLLLEAPSAFTATFNWYFFPGWWGWLDGQPLELRPTEEHGLIGADVPAGRHRLTIRFGDTSLRRWASYVSALSLVVSLLILLRPHTPTPPHPHTPTPPHPDRPALSSSRSSSVIISTALTALALFVVKITYLERYDSVFRHSHFDGQSVTDVQVPLQVNFDDQLMLMGYDLQPPPPLPRQPSQESPQSSYSSSTVLKLQLYWRALQPLDTNYSVAVHLIDSQGRRYGQKDSQHPAGYPTSRWQVDTYARDLHRLAIWPATPPGEYVLLIDVYDAATGHSLDVRAPSGTPVGPTYRLTNIQVTRPAHPPDPDNLKIEHRLESTSPAEPGVPLGGGIHLLGFDPPPDDVNAGDHFPITLYWRAVTAPDQNYTARLTLVGSDGTAVAEEKVPPGRASHPTSAWLAGDVVRDGRTFLLPANTPAGQYTLCLDLLDTAMPTAEPLSKAVNLHPVTVHAPERTFQLPSAQHPVSVTLSHQATLLGYDVSTGQTGEELSPGQPLTLTLYWQAERTSEVAYVVFVHLLDTAEHIYAQSDQSPAAGQRPTTGWLPDEIIRDLHTLDVAPDAPPGKYMLAIGMYDPATGERLHALDEAGNDMGTRILLPISIQVEPRTDGETK
jgi:hypothetical protein